jgi:tetratricopeptide (TPR) repeat protein
MAEDTMLAEAISAAKAGEMARARDLLARLLRADSTNPDYWLWMSSVVESERESVYCLRSVTKMRPGHPLARLGLTALGQISLAAERVGPVRQRRATPFPHQAAGSINSMADWWKIHRNRDNAMIAFLGMVLTVLSVFVIAGSLESGVPAITNAIIPARSSVTPSASNKNSDTQNTSANRISPIAKVGTPSGKVPLATYVNIQMTPTALYGVTPSSGAFDLGMKTFLTGQYSDALLQFQTAQRMNPNDAQISYYIAESLRNLKRMPESMEAYNHTIQLDPHFGLAYFGRAMWHKQDNPGSAYVEDLDEALALDPEMVDAYIERANYYSYLQADWLKAREDLEQAVALNPNHALALIRLGRAQLETGEKSEALINLFHAQVIDPTILEGYLGLGEAFYALGLYTLGAAPLTTYTAYAPGDIDGWILLCQMYSAAGEADNAVAAGTQALAIDTNSTHARQARGEAYRMGGKYLLAVVDLKVAQERAPNWFDAVFGYGRALVLSNNPNDAVAILNDAIDRAKLGKLSKPVTPAQMADLLGWDAQAYEKKGEPDHAMELWIQLYDLNEVPDFWKVEAYKQIYGLDNTPIPGLSNTPSASATPSAGTDSESNTPPVGTEESTSIPSN